MLRLAAFPLLALLTGCPQDIYGADGGYPSDAAVVAPVCKRPGPEFSCAPVTGAVPQNLVKEIAEFECSLPSGGREVAFKPLRSSVDLSFGVKQDATTGQVRIQLLRDKPLPVDFRDTTVTHFVTLSYLDDPDACTVRQLETRWAGNLWVVDQATSSRVVVFDSGGEQAGSLTLAGMKSPRALARMSDGVAVGGLDGANAAVAVYDLKGNRLRDYPELATALGSKVIRAMAALGTTLFVTTGRGQADAELWRLTDVTTDRIAPGYAGLAPLEGMVVAGATADSSYLRLSPSSSDGSDKASAQYRDADSEACTVQGAYSAAPLSAGGFIFSLKHVDKTGTPTGMLAVFSSGFAVAARTWHQHAGGAGRLAVAGPYDWMEELRQGVVLGVRDNSSTIERVDTSSIAPESGNAPEPWGKTSGLSPKGLLRLR